MKYLFIDRDGTLIKEPDDYQVDKLDKIRLQEDVIPVLIRFRDAGYRFVMITNQDGLGTDSFPQEDFDIPHDFIIQLFRSQGITFDEVLICPHLPAEGCSCRKPKTDLVMKYLRRTDWNREKSAVIGDRDSDMGLAKNMGIRGVSLATDFDPEGFSWLEIEAQLLHSDRIGICNRKTNETNISVQINLDSTAGTQIETGLGFLDHMLEQIAKHGQMSLQISCDGDLHVDDHHTAEDVGLAFGKALIDALGDKRGISRYGFLLPMDESLAQVALDFAGRPLFKFKADFPREKVGDLSTEMVGHFFRSISDAAAMNLHMKVKGKNTHHMVEGLFKAFARALKQAVTIEHDQLPSTKGVL